MRLIDADALIDYIESDISGLMSAREYQRDYIECIEEMPTVCDTDEFIEELNKYSVSNICRGRKCNSEEFSCEHCGASGVLELVKKRLGIL